MSEETKEGLKEAAKERLKKEAVKKFMASPAGGYIIAGVAITVAAVFLLLLIISMFMSFRIGSATEYNEEKSEMNEKIIDEVDKYEFNYIDSRIIQRTVVIVVEQINTYNTGEMDDPEDAKTLALNSRPVKNFIEDIVEEFEALDKQITEDTDLVTLFDEIAFSDTVHDFLKKQGLPEAIIEEYQQTIADFLSMDIEDVYENVDEEDKYFYDEYYDLKAIDLSKDIERMVDYIGETSLIYTPLEIKTNYATESKEFSDITDILDILIEGDCLIVYAPGITIGGSKDYLLLVGYNAAMELIFYNMDLTETTELISDFYPKIETIWIVE